MGNERKKPIRMWAGFVSGKVYREPFNAASDGYSNIPAQPIILFPSKRLAKTRFEDVRLVELREVDNGQ